MKSPGGSIAEDVPGGKPDIGQEHDQTLFGADTRPTRPTHLASLLGHQSRNIRVPALPAQRGRAIMTVAMPQTTQNDWVKTVLFDRGYLARIRGEAIKVYLAMIEACGGLPDQSVTISLSRLMRRTQLSCPTVIECLARLEELGLVVSTTRQRGKVTTYYISDPPAPTEPWSVIGDP
jgi:hypothetical protein